MTGRIETTILRSLMFNEEYARRVLPFIEDVYFQDKSERTVFQTTKQFVEQFNNLPTPEAIAITLGQVKGLNEEDFKGSMTVLDECTSDRDEHPNLDWLTEQTDTFCKDRAICNAVMEAVQIVTGEHQDKDKDRGAIPEMLSKALAVCLDPHIGHDYFEDADKRFDYYHKSEQKIPFDIEWFNKVTNGGIPAKTLNIFIAGTHVGKTLVMCHMASSYLKMGKNVLYITLEVSQEEITKRIDANLLNTAMDDLTRVEKLPKTAFQEKINALRKTTNGQLIAKEYPTAAAHSGHFRHLLNELRLKKKFIPHAVFIDYLNICASSRMKQGPNVNSYTYVKAISEELRGLGVEYNVPIITATQTNRSGFNSSDPGMEDTSESFGLPMTADFMAALVNSEELEKLNQYLVKILKCRYAYSQNKKFVVGVDRSKMRIYDVEQSAQEDIVGGAETSNKTDVFGATTTTGAPKPGSLKEQVAQSQWGQFTNKKPNLRALKV